MKFYIQLQFDPTLLEIEIEIAYGRHRIKNMAVRSAILKNALKPLADSLQENQRTDFHEIKSILQYDPTLLGIAFRCYRIKNMAAILKNAFKPFKAKRMHGKTAILKNAFKPLGDSLQENRCTDFL